MIVYPQTSNTPNKQNKKSNISKRFTACSAGANCLKVVAVDIGGTTAMDFHCSGSCPSCSALVAKWGNGVKLSSAAMFDADEWKDGGPDTENCRGLWLVAKRHSPKSSRAKSSEVLFYNSLVCIVPTGLHDITPLRDSRFFGSGEIRNKPNLDRLIGWPTDRLKCLPRSGAQLRANVLMGLSCQSSNSKHWFTTSFLQGGFRTFWTGAGKPGWNANVFWIGRMRVGRRTRVAAADL